MVISVPPIARTIHGDFSPFVPTSLASALVRQFNELEPSSSN
jgi:hypothetical protein